MSELAKWYEVNFHGVVSSVDVVKETEQMLLIRRDWYGRVEERRVKKDGYFRTVEEAVADTVRKVRANTEWKRKEYERARSREGDLRKLYPKCAVWNEPA